MKWKLANGVGSQSPFTLLRNLVYPALQPMMRTPRLPVVDWTDVPADLNGHVRFVERRNLVSVRVPSRFKRSLPTYLIVVWCRAPEDCCMNLSTTIFLFFCPAFTRLASWLRILPVDETRPVWRRHQEVSSSVLVVDWHWRAESSVQSREDLQVELACSVHSGVQTNLTIWFEFHFVFFWLPRRP